MNQKRLFSSSMTASLLALLVALPAAADGPATADTTKDAASASATVELQVEQATLSNGLRLVLIPDRSVPTVAVAVYYDVGSRNEVPGASGFAHLFEHMMFEGSANVAKNEHFKHIMGRGGDLNGTTSEDRTNYYETLPSNELELALWLESDRMRSLNITAENFENQRATVQSERKQNYDNRPYAMSFLRMQSLMYGDYWPYAHSTIGEFEDLQKAPLSAVQAFFDAYYAPNNAVLSIAGDFDVATAKELAEKYFASIPRHELRPYNPPTFSKASAEQRDSIEDAHANLPAVHVGYNIPPSRSADHYALEILAMILGDGDSARLHQDLVKSQELCSEVYVSTDDKRGPDVMSFFLLMSDGHTPKEGEQAVLDAIKNIIDGGVTEREIQRARNRVRAYFVFGLQSNLSRAKQFAEFELYHGDAKLLRTEAQHYAAVTREDVQRVATKYLAGPAGRSVLHVTTGAKQ